MTKRIVRIGAGCSADTTIAWPQMANHGELDYFLADYLYEASVAGYAAELVTDPDAGYSKEFVGPDLEPHLQRLVERGVKIITNAGGLNPLGCAKALQAVTDRLGLKARIAVVHGDDVLEWVNADMRDMFSGAALPGALVSANAYLGAMPIARALAKGADIVITGRVVDSALIVAPLMHEFGWAWDDYERLGAATLIGHLLECGPQPSGGIYTDWREIDWTDPSFPIAECHPDGTAVIYKVPGTGGQVSVGTTSEQILYEIGDPYRYFMPDVTCDLSGARLEVVGQDRVRVSGATGRAPTSTYKVCCMEQLGWRSVVSGVLSGPDVIEKAEKTTQAILARMEKLNGAAGLAPALGSSVELIGSGDSQGARRPSGEVREIVYRIVFDHVDRRGAESLLRVTRAAGVSMAPGSAGLLGFATTPLMKMHSVLMEKSGIPVYVTLDGETEQVRVPEQGGFDEATIVRAPALRRATFAETPAVNVPLVKLAWTRSGDKGNLSNIGVIARRPDYMPYLAASLTSEAVRQWFSHLYETPVAARVELHEVPGLNALNFMLHNALAGGAVSSRRFDPMGKGLGQQLIDFPVRVPEDLARHLA